MNICICGGGSLGIVCAGVFLAGGNNVRLLSGHPEKWEQNISVHDCNGRIYSGRLDKISSDPKLVVPGADLILCCVPGYLIEETLVKIRPYINDKVFVGSIVSSTGFFFIAHKVLDPKQKLFGFQRVPFISRIREYGVSGDLLGYKKSLNVAIENNDFDLPIKQKLEDLFMTPINLLDSYYEAALTNSNPILHTGRLYSMWKDYNGEYYDHQGLFYSEWTDEASEILISMDQEFMSLLEVIGVKKGVIPSLLDYYESKDATSLTNKIKSIEAFRSIQSPMTKGDKGWYPDFSSRYFTEDFPFGLKFIRDLCIERNVSCPTIDKVYAWGMSKLK